MPAAPARRGRRNGGNQNGHSAVATVAETGGAGGRGYSNAAGGAGAGARADQCGQWHGQRRLCEIAANGDRPAGGHQHRRNGRRGEDGRVLHHRHRLHRRGADWLQLRQWLEWRRGTPASVTAGGAAKASIALGGSNAVSRTVMLAAETAVSRAPGTDRAARSAPWRRNADAHHRLDIGSTLAATISASATSRRSSAADPGASNDGAACWTICFPVTAPRAGSWIRRP